jgi:isopentenyl-diphosphate Delta-isomerase
MEEVILVDEDDKTIGTCEKLAAHQAGGKLHRAFSIFIFHPDGRLMLQQRALAKYHFGGLWTNTCCSHPRPGEATIAAATRRLQEEMGFVTDLTEKTVFTYRAEDAKTMLTEHEVDHVLIGVFSGDPMLNPDEVMDWRWVEIADLERDLSENPTAYTSWFPIAFHALKKNI